MITFLGDFVLKCGSGTAQSNMISKMDHGIHFLEEQRRY